MKQQTLDSALQRLQESKSKCAALVSEYHRLIAHYGVSSPWRFQIEPKPDGWDEKKTAYLEWEKAYKEMKKRQYYYNRLAKSLRLYSPPD